jgi:heat shock protein HslJ
MRLTLLVLFAAGLWACQSDKKGGESQAGAQDSTTAVVDSSATPPASNDADLYTSELEGTAWNVKYVDYEGGQFKPDTIRDVEIRFNRGIINGLGLCNRLTSNYTTADSAKTMTLADIRMSENTICDPNRTRFDRRFFDVLKQVKTYRYSQGGLMLDSEKGRILCVEK